MLKGVSLRIVGRGGVGDAVDSSLYAVRRHVDSPLRVIPKHPGRQRNDLYIREGRDFGQSNFNQKPKPNLAYAVDFLSKSAWSKRGPYLHFPDNWFLSSLGCILASAWSRSLANRHDNSKIRELLDTQEDSQFGPC